MSTTNEERDREWLRAIEDYLPEIFTIEPLDPVKIVQYIFEERVIVKREQPLFGLRKIDLS